MRRSTTNLNGNTAADSTERLSKFTDAVALARAALAEVPLHMRNYLPTRDNSAGKMYRADLNEYRDMLNALEHMEKWATHSIDRVSGLDITCPEGESEELAHLT